MKSFALLLLFAGLAAPAEFYLHDGDTVLFHGDSITEGRHYNGLVETFVTTRFPAWNVRWVHHGWGGEKVSGGPGGPIDIRLRRDDIAWKPTVAVIMLGMNDGEYRPFHLGIHSAYCRGYTHIVRALKEALPGLRITAVRPSPFDEVTRGLVYPHSYNQTLIRFGEYVADLAAVEHLHLTDLNAPIVAMLEQAKRLDPESAGKLFPDHVHPDPAGHLLLAAELLRSWNAPALVTAVEIDAAKDRVTRADNTTVTGVKGLTWTQHDRALPMAIDRRDPVFALALQVSDFDRDLNHQPLRITGLAPGRYELKIDGQPVVTRSHAEWAKGVELAALNTPMTRQSAAVHELMARHNKVHYFRWRLPVPLEGDQDWPQLKRAVEAMDELEAEYIRRQHAAAQPTAHRYSLTTVRTPQ